MEAELKSEAMIIVREVVESGVKFNSDEAGIELMFFAHLKVGKNLFVVAGA